MMGCMAASQREGGVLQTQPDRSKSVGPHGRGAASPALWATLILFVLLAGRQWMFATRWSADVMYWDQWDVYRPLFADGGTWRGWMPWWASFDYQHGPHRQGVGGLVIRLLAGMSRWNTRWDALSISATLMGACLLGLLLARRCGVHPWALPLVPIIFFNARQYEDFVSASNVAHGAMPMLLLMGYCLAWTDRHRPRRLLAVALLNFLLIFTGFGIFAGLLTPLLLAVELRDVLRGEGAGQSQAWMVAAAMAAVALAWGAFAWNYQLNKVGADLSLRQPQDYLYLASAMLANFFGVDTFDATMILFGLLLLLLLLVLAVGHGSLLLRRGIAEQSQRRSVAIFVLCAFELLYVVDTAIGRISLGWTTGAESRYVTLMISMGLAFLLAVGASSWPKMRWLLLPYAAALLAGTVVLNGTDWHYIQGMHEGRLRWRLAYLQTGSQAAADLVARFRVYPEPVLADRLQFLQAHELNLCDPDMLDAPQ